MSSSLAQSKSSHDKKEKQLIESKKLAESYHDQIQHLENALAIHTQETVATDALVSKIKSLHAEHCESLEKEISSLKKSCEDKSKSNSQLKKKIEGLTVKTQSVEESNDKLKSFIKKMEELDNEKKNVISSYEEKLQVIISSSDSYHYDLIRYTKC